MKKYLTVVTIAAFFLTTACGKTASTFEEIPHAQSKLIAELPEVIAQESKITSFADVNTDKVKLIALGNSDVPVGQYSEEIFTNLGCWEDIQGKISFGTNVKEVLSQVEEGAVDCGVVYATDAATAEGVTVLCSAPDESLKTPVIYPAAALAKTENKAAAEAFLDFLLTDEAKNEFEKVGFKIAATDAPKGLIAQDGSTLTIFAAASMTESLTEIGKLFNEKYPKIELIYNYDSSGTLLKQIESGASADIFISAAQKQMKALNEGGYIDADTMIDLLKNEVVLIVPEK